MTEATHTYTQEELDERREVQRRRSFRRSLGALAAMGLIAAVGYSAGGARPLAHDTVEFIKHRVEMIGDAFSHPDAISTSPDVGTHSPDAHPGGAPTSPDHHAE